VPERNAKERLRAGTEAAAGAGVVGVPTLAVVEANIFLYSEACRFPCGLTLKG
ncbi:MAG: hypothetical protein ICV73_27450, partial [Acetobacteraceae bacterium]|nr:hypothetical protein [Acetobacteraceae bacterium]